MFKYLKIQDLKLTREICHLPLLWLKPENRNYQTIYERIKYSCSKDGIFLNILLLAFF